MCIEKNGDEHADDITEEEGEIIEPNRQQLMKKELHDLPNKCITAAVEYVFVKLLLLFEYDLVIKIPDFKILLLTGENKSGVKAHWHYIIEKETQGLCQSQSGDIKIITTEDKDVSEEDVPLIQNLCFLLTADVPKLLKLSRIIITRIRDKTGNIWQIEIKGTYQFVNDWQNFTFEQIRYKGGGFTECQI